MTYKLYLHRSPLLHHFRPLSEIYAAEVWTVHSLCIQAGSPWSGQPLHHMFDLYQDKSYLDSYSDWNELSRELIPGHADEVDINEQ